MTAAANTHDGDGAGDQPPGRCCVTTVFTGPGASALAARGAAAVAALARPGGAGLLGRAVLGQCLSSMLVHDAVRGRGRADRGRPSSPSLGRQPGHPRAAGRPRRARRGRSVRSCGDTGAAAGRRPDRRRRRSWAEVSCPSTSPPRSSSSGRRNPEHGDYATNVALRLAKPAGRPPREVAELLAAELRAQDGIERVDVAGPGFLNITLAEGALGLIAVQAVTGGRRLRAHRRAGRPAAQPRVRLRQPDRPGAHRRHPVGGGRRRARPAARVQRRRRSRREYYFNDAGAQIDRFARSLLAAAHGPPDARGRLRRRLHRRHRGAGGRRRARACSSGRTTSSSRVFRDRGVAADVRRDPQHRWPTFGVALRRLLQREVRCTTAGRWRRRSPGCGSRATSTSPTARCGCGRRTSATTRTASWSRPTASRPTSRPTAPTTWTSASAASTRS